MHSSTVQCIHLIHLLFFQLVFGTHLMLYVTSKEFRREILNLRYNSWLGEKHKSLFSFLLLMIVYSAIVATIVIVVINV